MFEWIMFTVKHQNRDEVGPLILWSTANFSDVRLFLFLGYFQASFFKWNLKIHGLEI